MTPEPMRPSEPWYRKEQFAILPLFRSRPADEWNVSLYGVSWLFFHAWTGSLFTFGVGFNIRGVRYDWPTAYVELPYLMVTVHLPIPMGWLRQFSRLSAGQRRDRA